MKKSKYLLASLAFLATLATTAAAIFLDNNGPMFTAAINNQTVGHTITYTIWDNIQLVEGGDRYQGFFCFKPNATMSGAEFQIDACIVGKGGIKQARVDNYLLKCETTDEEATIPTHTIEILFGFKNIAAFESVVIHGKIYTNKEKTEIVDNYIFTPGDGYCSYNESNGEVEIVNKGFFKAAISSIDINYSCPIY